MIERNSHYMYRSQKWTACASYINNINSSSLGRNFNCTWLPRGMQEADMDHGMWEQEERQEQDEGLTVGWSEEERQGEG